MLKRLILALHRIAKVANRAVSAPAGLLVSRIVVSLAAVVTSPMIARSTGAEGRGLIAAAMTVLMILPVALALGLPWAVRRRCALNPSSSDQIVRSAEVLAIPMILPAVGIGIGLNESFLSELPHAAQIWFLGGLALTPLIISRNCLYSVLVVHERFRALFFATVSQPIVNVVAVVILFTSSHLTIATAIASTTLSIAVSFAVTLSIDAGKKIGGTVPLKGLLKESVSAAGAQISEIASYRLNQLVLLPVIGSAALGNYAVAVNISLAPAPVGQAIGTATFRRSATIDELGRRQIAESTLRAAISVGVCIAVVLGALSPFVVPLLFGPDFSSAVVATQILSVGLVFVIANYTLTSNLIAQGLSTRASVAQYLGFSIGTALVIAMGLFAGLAGAAIGSVLGFVVTSIASSLFLGVGLSAWVPTVTGIRDAVSILKGRKQ